MSSRLAVLASVARKAAPPPTGVFLLHATLSLGFDAYTRWPALDLPMHVLGGVAIALFFARSLDELERASWIASSRGPLRGLLLLGLTALAALAWELAEFGADRWFEAGAQVGLADTLLDQVLGLVGGLAVAGLELRRT